MRVVATGPDTSRIGGKLQRLGFRNYAEYLASDHWRELRERYRASDRPQFCECGSRKVSLHHLTYERLGAERLTDLIAVCRDCHRKLHGRRKRKRRRGFRGVTVTHVEPAPRSRAWEDVAPRIPRYE